MSPLPAKGSTARRRLVDTMNSETTEFSQQEPLVWNAPRPVLTTSTCVVRFNLELVSICPSGLCVLSPLTFIFSRWYFITVKRRNLRLFHLKIEVSNLFQKLRKMNPIRPTSIPAVIIELPILMPFPPTVALDYSERNFLMPKID